MSAQPKLRKGFREVEISIETGTVTLEGTLALPQEPQGIVLFAHGSGSSRHSPRNRYVAGVIQAEGIATLLFDLLTRREESVDQRTAELRFNIPLLANRLAGATNWVIHHPELTTLRIGYFGASTGAAAALSAASQLRADVGAIVSRGGKPDLASEALDLVEAPTLLIVGANDPEVLELNRWALAQLRCAEKKLVTIPGATHLFEEPGALEEVAGISAQWFARYLAPAEDPNKRQPSLQASDTLRRSRPPAVQARTVRLPPRT